MKNWLKNLLFVLFSFLFLGLGMIVAEIFIREKGNPLKDPNFLTETPTNPIDSTQGWENDTIKVTPLSVQEPEKEKLTQQKSEEKKYLVIIGMFGQKAKANRELKKLKDLGYENAYIFAKSSMDVVSAGHFEKKEAENVASELRNKGFQTIIKQQ